MDASQVRFSDRHGFLAIAIIAVATYWQTLGLPLIQDDWVFLNTSRQGDVLSLLIRAFDVRNAVLYRPAALTYLFVNFRIFGDDAWPGHALALSIHTCNCILVFAMMQRLNRHDAVVNLAVAALYASGFAVHLDSQCWLAGIIDLGATLFFLISITSFLKGNDILSCAAYVASVLFKESAIVLPAIAILAANLQHRSLEGTVSAIWRLRGHLIFLGLFAALRIYMGLNPATLSTDNPYLIKPDVPIALDNLYHYAAWMIQALLPFGGVDSHRFMIGVALVLALILIGMSLSRSSESWRIAIWLAWAFVALSPVIFLPNHSYRYYATLALPPFLAALFLALRVCAEALFGRGGGGIFVIGGLAGLAIAISVYQSNRIFWTRSAARVITGGSNDLVRRASFVKPVQRQLLREVPAPSTGATFIFKGVDAWGFGAQFGPRYWYRREDLHVLDFSDIRRDPRGLFVIDGEAGGRKSYLSEGNFYPLLLQDGKLVSLSEESIRAMVPEQR